MTHVSTAGSGFNGESLLLLKLLAFLFTTKGQPVGPRTQKTCLSPGLGAPKSG